MVVDTLGRWMAPLDLDRWKQSDVDTVLTPLERIVRRSGTALVAVHHANAAGKPIDSTGFAAWADVLRKVEDGDDPRERRVTGRARFEVPDLRFRLREDADGSRLVSVDRNRGTDERILDFVEANPGCSKSAVRSGVTGSREAIDRRLRALVRDGIVEVDRSGRSHSHRIAENPRSHGAATVRRGPSHDGAGNGGGDRGAAGSPPPYGEGDPSPRSAEPAEDGETPKRCACGTRIGPTAATCTTCKRRRTEVRAGLPDTGDVVEVGELGPTSPLRRNGGG